jgi:predicted GH43/DUF377 family glycosyl hydrolase
MRLAGQLIVVLLLLTGCGRYAEFTLPELQTRSGPVKWEWTRHSVPVLPRGNDFGRVDTLNPSVARANGLFVNAYSGYDGKTWHTALAESADGLHWMRRGVILSPDSSTWEGDYIAANGSLLITEKGWLYWYQGGREPRIGLATSTDGRNWKKQGAPVMNTGPRGSWDERGVADPYVIRAGPMFYMYYLGQDRARRQRLGVARSADGIQWEKLRSNPILELGDIGAFDDTGLGEPAVWQQHGSYWMLYTARDAKENRRLGLARSQDGVHWERMSKGPVFSGSEPWESRVVCDASVLPAEGGEVHVWYGGGDRAEPAENLNGQIGYARLRLQLSAAGGSR